MRDRVAWSVVATLVIATGLSLPIAAQAGTRDAAPDDGVTFTCNVIDPVASLRGEVPSDATATITCAGRIEPGLAMGGLVVELSDTEPRVDAAGTVLDQPADVTEVEVGSCQVDEEVAGRAPFQCEPLIVLVGRVGLVELRDDDGRLDAATFRLRPPPAPHGGFERVRSIIAAFGAVLVVLALYGWRRSRDAAS